MHFKYAALALSAVLPFSSAQTYSDCNPLKKTCDPVSGLDTGSYTADFTTGESALDKWKTTGGKVSFGSDGAEFTINKKGDAPTIDTNFHVFFGKVEVTMKAAPGTGVVSSIVLESDVLDEIDWEALGGDTTQIQTNYFGKGDTSSYDRATFETVATPQETFHTYTVDWTKDQMSWAIDGNVVRTVAYNDAKGGTRFPQTPMRLRLGIWAGGDSDNAEGTIQWAGGETDYSGAPYTMYVKSVKVTNYNPASSYTYTDNSGSYDSIKKGDAKVSESSSTSSEVSSAGTTLTTSVSSASTKSEAEAATTTAGATTTGGSTATGTGVGAASTTGAETGAETASETGAGAASQTGAAATTGGSGSGSSSGTSTGSAEHGGETGAGHGSGSGSVISSSPAGGVSPSGTPSPSGSVSGASPSPSLFHGAASPSTGTSVVLAILGLMTALLQL
ncbi:transglycosylase [Aspergillus melleus]|uniref:Transglycosylase n=1 Tax=Aspergillus melleus TaxID=138277 RepID=A0ACC3B8H0_9EURO|nr:transglycosylase [Aspergillus melleus]